MTDHDCKTLLDLAAKATPDMVPDVQHMDGWYIACGPHHPDEAAAHDDAAYLAAAANAVPWLIEDRRRLMSGILGSLQTCEVCRCRYDRANGAMCKCERRRPYRIKLEESQAEVERLRAENEQHRAWFGCPSCGENHPDGTMCPPHEMRTTGREWFHAAIRAAKADNERLRADLEKVNAFARTFGYGQGQLDDDLAGCLMKSFASVETLCDPAGVVRESKLARDENAMLRTKIQELKTDLEAENAAAAAMREFIERFHNSNWTRPELYPVVKELLASDASKGWVSPEEHAKVLAQAAAMVAAVAQFRKNVETSLEQRRGYAGDLDPGGTKMLERVLINLNDIKPSAAGLRELRRREAAEAACQAADKLTDCVAEFGDKMTADSGCLCGACGERVEILDGALTAWRKAKEATT